MKPRPNLLPLSEEDTEIWHLVVDRFYMWSAYYFVRSVPYRGLWAHSLEQGRRDALTMLNLLLEREAFWNVPAERCMGGRWWDL